mmetsp:Transcript_9536/g.19882  ORF Transcript_9536/g.19882 Transcript_9536/m.19882 type:complete len:85 (-) Transcript_9536:353-607(-)
MSVFSIVAILFFSCLCACICFGLRWSYSRQAFRMTRTFYSYRETQRTWTSSYLLSLEGKRNQEEDSGMKPSNRTTTMLSYYGTT